jgi:hypothetical protein
MKLSHFVSGSAAVLAGWLAVTFFHAMPSQRYPKLQKYPATTLAPQPTKPVVSTAAKEIPVAQVSVSP